MACYKANCSPHDIWRAISKNVPLTISGLLQGKMFLWRYLVCYKAKCSSDDIWPATRQNVPLTISGLLQGKLFLWRYLACYKVKCSSDDIWSATRQNVPPFLSFVPINQSINISQLLISSLLRFLFAWYDWLIIALLPASSISAIFRTGTSPTMYKTSKNYKEMREKYNLDYNHNSMDSLKGTQFLILQKII
jgi:hypothetical protein